MKVVKSLENRTPQIMRALETVALSGKYSEGIFSKVLESQLEEVTKKRTRVVNSCGSALYLVFRFAKESLRLAGALIQNNTFFATGAMAKEAGLEVALVDSRPDCPGMSVDSLVEAHRSTGFRMVVLTHVGGWLAKDYFAIANYCDANGLLLVEDCAHVLGVPEAGAHSFASTWSFYPTKAVPCGEGGAVSTNNLCLANFVSSFREYGKNFFQGVMSYQTGMNLRMSEWDAAVMSVQLDHLPDILAARQRDAEMLQSIAPCLMEGESNYYKFPVAARNDLRTVGKVYEWYDRLDHSLLVYDGVLKPVPLDHSIAWSEKHVCLPVGEGLYDGKTREEVLQLLTL